MAARYLIGDFIAIIDQQIVLSKAYNLKEICLITTNSSSMMRKQNSEAIGAIDSFSDSSLAVEGIKRGGISQGNTTAQTLDESFQEVTAHRKGGRREEKLLQKEKM